MGRDVTRCCPVNLTSGLLVGRDTASQATARAQLPTPPERRSETQPPKSESQPQKHISTALHASTARKRPDRAPSYLRRRCPSAAREEKHAPPVTCRLGGRLRCRCWKTSRPAVRVRRPSRCALQRYPPTPPPLLAGWGARQIRHGVVSITLPRTSVGAFASSRLRSSSRAVLTAGAMSPPTAQPTAHRTRQGALQVASGEQVSTRDTQTALRRAARVR